MTIETSHGAIKLPAFFPVTTFGDKYPLDKLVQPYLKRTNPCLMVSHYYAQKMKKRPDMPIFIDSGGFAGLFEGSVFKDYGDHASIVTKGGDEIHPLEVLRFQEKNADLGATLDFIIPPKTDLKEAQCRLDLTLKNAQYALNNLSSATSHSSLITHHSTLFLYASLQCWDPDSARHAAKEYVRMGFKGIAIGGMVPRIRDAEYVKSIVSTVRKAAPKSAIHVFGIGSPKLIPPLLDCGADSFDSSGYVRAAVGVREKTEELAGLHTNLYSALNNLSKINNCFGSSFTMPSTRMFERHQSET